MRLAIFASYFEGPLPHAVGIYLDELRRHNDRVVLVTNSAEAHRGCMLLTVPNEGYDFGMWARALERKDLDKISRLTLANDSCFLIRRLDDFYRWVGDGYMGLINSNEITPHIQSYFQVMTQPAIRHFAELCAAQGIPKTYQDAIQSYELRLLKYMEGRGVRCSTQYRINQPEYARNPSMHEFPCLVKMGFPLLKRRLVNGGMNLPSIRRFYQRWGYVMTPARAAKMVIDPPHPSIPELVRATPARRLNPIYPLLWKLRDITLPRQITEPVIEI